MAETLVLNSAYMPLGAIPETDAICLITTGKAWAMKNDPSKVFHAKYVEIPAPRIVVLNHYVHMNSFRIRPAKLTNAALFKRDKYKCQYCGRTRESLKGAKRLTRDHIVPRDLGGKDTWENVTTACSDCNHKKANKTLKQARMRLLSAPTIPVTWTIRGKSKLTQEQIDYIESSLNLKKDAS